MKVCNRLIYLCLRSHFQLDEGFLRVFRHVLLLDLSILGVNFRFAIVYLVSSAFYGFT